MLVSTLSLSKPALELQERIINDKNSGSKLLVRTYSNLKSGLIKKTNQEQINDFPTQIIRMDGTVKNPDIDCRQLFDEFSSLLLDKIHEHQMFVSESMGCGKTQNDEKNLYIHLIIEPMTDDAINSMKDLINQYNGTDFYGIPILFEPAKALIVSLNIKAVHDIDPDNEVLVYPFTMQKSLYLININDVWNSLEQDIEDQLFSVEEDYILSFFKKWNLSSWDYSQFIKALKISNQVDIVNEYNFLMEKEPKLVSIEAFRHLDCSSLSNPHCL